MKLAVREPQSSALRAHLRRRRPIVSSALARTEVIRALLPLEERAIAKGHEVLRRIDVFNSPTGAVIRELIADGQGDTSLATAFRERFLNHLRQQAIECLQRGAERGEITHPPDPEAVVDLLYGPIWMRLVLGHQPLTHDLVDELLDLTWPGLTRKVDEPESPAGDPGDTNRPLLGLV